MLRSAGLPSRCTGPNLGAAASTLRRWDYQELPLRVQQQFAVPTRIQMERTATSQNNAPSSQTRQAACRLLQSLGGDLVDIFREAIDVGDGLQLLAHQVLPPLVKFAPAREGGSHARCNLRIDLVHLHAALIALSTAASYHET